MCLYSTWRENKKYVANKKNGGVIPVVHDKRALLVETRCGKCMECMKQKANGWRTRLLEEVREDKTGVFVTWSFNDESLEKLAKKTKGIWGYEQDNEIAKVAMRYYWENWRSATGKSVKHWCVTEIGGRFTERIHVHGIVWTNNVELIKKKWKYGNVYLGEYVNESTCHYIVKYLHKTDEKHKEYISRIFTSSGIGKGYTERRDSNRNKYQGERTNQTYKSREGKVMALPSYYRRKMYTDEEREQMWMEMLDKGEKWVDGRSVETSQYEKVREEARKKNKRLGWGDDEKDWERKHYENSLRRKGQKLSIKKKPVPYFSPIDEKTPLQERWGEEWKKYDVEKIKERSKITSFKKEDNKKTRETEKQS